jgi:PKD repeat protein
MKELAVCSLLMIVGFCSCSKAEDDPVVIDPPVAQFSVSITSLTVSLTNESVGADSCSWDFGDNSLPVADNNPTHRYAKDGTYAITLRVFNLGGEATASQQVTVTKDPFEGISIMYQANVTVNESDSHPMDRNMIGLAWGQEPYHGENILGSRSSTTLSQEFIEMAKNLRNTFAVSRVSGGESSYFIYTDNIGPYSERVARPSVFQMNMPLNTLGNPLQPDPSYLNTFKSNFGPAEFVKAAYELTPDMSFIFCLNMVTGTPEQSRELAEYLRGASTTEWGAKRVNDGIPNPVNVAMYELGNELNWVFRASTKLQPWECAESLDVNEYIRVAKLHIEAVRKADPTAKFLLNGSIVLDWSTGAEGMDWRSWNQAICAALKDDVDYISFHPYYNGTAQSKYEEYMDYIHQDCEQYAGRVLPMVHTEHAKWPENIDLWSMDPVQLQGALCVAEFYNRMYRRGDVWGSTYFIASMQNNGYWAVFSHFGSSDLVLSGVGHMQNAYVRGLGDRVLKAEVGGGSTIVNHKSTDCRFTALVTAQGNDEVKVILVNRMPYAGLNVDFTFQNKYKLVEEVIFTAPETESYVKSAATVDIFSTTVTAKDEANFSSYKMQPKCMTILKLKKTN